MKNLIIMQVILMHPDEKEKENIDIIIDFSFV